MGMDIREVFHKGQWFAIEGKKKTLKSLSDEKISELCQNFLTQKTTPGFTVRPLGSRTYTAAPTPSAEETKSFVSKRLEALHRIASRFIEFVTGRKAKENEEKMMQLRFAMQLFDSSDEELLTSLLQPGSGDAPLDKAKLSSLLGLWTDTLAPQLPKDDPKIMQLKKLQSYQQSIEALRRIKHPKSRADARQKLNTRILQDLKNLPKVKDSENVQPAEILYLPGGIWDPKEEKSFPMIYEVTKFKGWYKLRALDISGKIFKAPSASKPAQIPREAQREGLDKAPEEKTTPQENYLEGSCAIDEGKINTQINNLTLILSGWESPTKQIIKVGLLWTIFLSLKVKLEQAIFGMDEWEATREADKESFLKKIIREEGSPSKIKKPKAKPLETPKKGTQSEEKSLVPPRQVAQMFLKTIFPDEYKKHKLSLKARFLLSTWERAGKMVEDPEFRNLIRTQINNLLPFTLNQESLQNQLSHIIKELDQFDEKQTLPLPQGGAVPHTISTKFSTPLNPELKILPPSSFKVQTPKPLSLTEVTDISQIVDKKDIAALHKHIETLNTLANKGEFTLLHYHLRHDFSALKMLNEGKIIIMAEQPDKWMDQIKQLNGLVQRCSYGLGRISPSAEDISFALLGFKLQDQIARNAASLARDPYVTDHVFDIEPIEKILKNPYLSLGEWTKDIESSLTYFKALIKGDKKHKAKEPLRGTWFGDDISFPTSSKTQDSREKDINFFRKYYSRELELDPKLELGPQLAKLAEDINGQDSIHQPPHIVHLRQSYLLLQSFVAPTRTFMPATLEHCTHILSSIQEEVGATTVEELVASGGPLAYQKIAQKIPEFLQLRAIKGPISFSVRSSIFAFTEKFLSVEPFGLSFNDLDERLQNPLLGSRFSFEHTGSFDRNGIPIADPSLRERGFEQVVGERSDKLSEERGFEDDGKVPDLAPQDPFIEHRMKGRTEWQILQDRARILGLDTATSEQLQLMETGPKTIVQNTLAFIAENKALLGDKKYGPAIFRLVERNLFRNAAFTKASEEVQQFAFRKLSKLTNEALATGNISLALRCFSILREMAVQDPSLVQDLQTKLGAENIEILAKKQGCARLLYQEQFFADKMNPTLASPERISVLFKLKGTPPIFEETDPTLEKRIDELLIDEMKTLKDTPKDKVFLEKILTSLEKQVPSKDAAPIPADNTGLVFTYGQYQIDLSRMEIWENGKRQAFLPQTITESSSFSALTNLIGPQARTSSWVVSPIITPETEGALEGRSYSLQVPEKNLELRVIQTNEGTIRIYRRELGKKWFQFEPTMFAPLPKGETLHTRDIPPRFIQQGDCWVREDGKELVVEKKGVSLCTGKLSGLPSPQILSLEKIDGDKKTTIVNAFTQPEFKRFCAIENPGHIIAHQSGKTLERIEYTRTQAPYSLAWKEGHWYSEQQEGYFLSEKTLDTLTALPPPSDKDSENPAVHETHSRLQKLFNPAFTSYHILEHNSKYPQLVMPRVTIEPPKNVKDPTQRFIPQFNGEKIVQYTFDIHPIKGLVPEKQPEGYLYLAYSLAVQGNYQEAFLFLDKANLKKPLDAEGREIFDWLEKKLESLPQQDPQVLLLRTRLFLMKPLLLKKPVNIQSIDGQIISFNAYQLEKLLEEKKASLPVGMKLSSLEESELHRLKQSAMLSFVYSLTEDDERLKIAENIPELLQGLFETPNISGWKTPQDITDIFQRLPLIKLHEEGKITEEEFDALTQRIPYLFLEQKLYECIRKTPEDTAKAQAYLDELKRQIDTSEQNKSFFDDFNRLQALESLKLWKDFDAAILKPFNISMKELLFMKEAGELDKLFSSLSGKQKEAGPLLIQRALTLSKIREEFTLRNDIQNVQRAVAAPPHEKKRLEKTKPTSLFTTEEQKKWSRFFETPSSSQGATSLKEDAIKNIHQEKKEKETYAETSSRELREDCEYKLRESPDIPIISKLSFFSDDEYRKLLAAVLKNSTELEKLKKIFPGLSKAGVEAFLEKTIKGEIPLQLTLKTFLIQKTAPKALKTREGLRDVLVQSSQEKQNLAIAKRADCLRLLQKEQRPLTLSERARRVGTLPPETLFDTALRCYGEQGNFTRLEELGVKLTDVNSATLKKALKEYLQLSIQARQLHRALEIEASLPQDVLSEEYRRSSRDLVSTLESSWQYDVENDPLAPTLLLIEYELGFVCRGSQIDVVLENLNDPNRFKQEMCGGGKTTVLRNIISQFRADGATLSGVSTLEPLRAEHGLMYARTTKNAFSEAVFDFHFDRTTPTPVNSLLHLHLDLLQTTVERGRLDLSKGDLQSFKLAMILKQEEIQENRKKLELPSLSKEDREVLEKDINRLHSELDVMEDIRDFLYDHVAIMADELDKDCDPTQEKNYSYGNSVEINLQKREAILTILEKLLVNSSRNMKTLGEAIQNKNQARLDQTVIANAIKELVSSLYNDYKEICTEEEFLAYLIKPDTTNQNTPQKAEASYKKIFGQYDGKELPLNLQKLYWIQQFLWNLFTPEAALAKREGVSYGRAKDGVSVIPYAGSDKPKERSQHGNDLERLVYTSLDYVQNGLSPGQVRAAYIKAKEEGLKEVVAAYQAGKTLELDLTKAAKKFQNEFLAFAEEPKPTLSTITEETLTSIQKKITENPAVLLQFLRNVVLNDLRQSEKKIVSDAQDPPYMVKSYGGSSGTDSGCYALPDKINKKDARQKGVHGEIIRWLLETEAGPRRPEAFPPETFLTGDREPYDILASAMKGGDCLSDVGRLFPGIPPRTIAETLLKKIPSVNYAVFMNPEDKWVMLKREGSEFVEVEYTKSEDPKVLKDRITIFDDVHTRGAERSSTEGVTEFVTVDIDTDWSRFEQGVMRERNLTKGKANLRYILTPALEEKLKQESLEKSVNGLLTILTENETKQLKVLNYKAERQRINHILKRTGEKALRDLSREGRKQGMHQHHLVREKVYRELQDLYVVSNETDVFQTAPPQGEEETSKVLDDLVKKQLDRLTKIENAIRADTTIETISTPVQLASVKGNLESLKTNIDAILKAQDAVKKALEVMTAEYKKSAPLQKITPDAVDKTIKDAPHLFSSPDVQKQITALKENSTLLEKALKDLETISKTAAELSIDTMAPIKQLCSEAHLQSVEAIKTIEAQKKALQGQKDEIIETEELVPPPPPEKPGLFGVLKKTGQSVLKGVGQFVEKIAKKVYSTVFAWTTNDSVQKVIESLTNLETAFKATQDTLKTIEHAGTPLVSIAIDSLEEARAELQAKLAGGSSRVDSKFLPEHVAQGTGDLDNEQEVEQEQEQEQEVEQVAEAVVEESKGEVFPHIPFEFLSRRALLSDYLPSNIHNLSSLTPLLPEGKLFTENCFPLTRSQGKIRPWEQVKEGTVTIPAAQQHLDRTLFVMDRVSNKVVELYGSRLDAERTFPSLKTGEDYVVLTYNYSLGDFEQDVPEELKPLFFTHIATTKLLRGETSFPQKEIFDALVAHLSSLSKEKRTELEEATKRIVAASKKGAFEESDLAKAFAEAVNK